MTAVTFMNTGLNLIRDAIATGSTPEITYVALSTDGTSPSATDTTLASEVYRQAIANVADGASAGEGILTATIDSEHAAGVVIAKIGWFGGSGATTVAGSGVLVAEVLYSHTHGAESLQLSLDYTV